MFAYFFTIIAAAVTLSVFLRFRVGKELYKAIFFKAITSFLFMACAIVSFLSSGSTAFGIFQALIVLGLLCGLFGDLWLDLKNMHPEAKDVYQFIGMGSFLSSHLFFVPALFLASGKAVGNLLFGVGFGILFAVGVMVFEKPMKVHYGKYKLITFFYSLTIGASTGFSIINFIKSGFAAQSLFLMVGMLCVILSDIILSGTYFGEGKDRPVDIVSNHSLYYIGQFFVASALLFA
ncbi:MAG: hypothetical protein IJU39_02700 [Clostridia bacterium]|nr:hypothetical protein [Clostridia bacterium]